MKRWSGILAAIVITILVAVVAYKAGSAAKDKPAKYQPCSGAADCTICKNCSHCKWCKAHPDQPCGVKAKRKGRMS